MLAMLAPRNLTPRFLTVTGASCYAVYSPHEALIFILQLVNETKEGGFDVSHPRDQRFHRRIQLLFLPLLKKAKEKGLI